MLRKHIGASYNPFRRPLLLLLLTVVLVLINKYSLLALLQSASDHLRFGSSKNLTLTSSGKSKKRYSGISNDTTVDDGESTKQKKWNLLKETICPNMIPNSNIWSTLFELARIELAFAKERIPFNPLDETFTKQFFTFSSGGLGYESSDKLHHMVYLTIWKAGNNQIRNSLRSTMKNSTGTVWDTFPLSFEQGWSKLVSPIPKTQLNETCVVTAVRDPITHFMSGKNLIYI